MYNQDILCQEIYAKDSLGYACISVLISRISEMNAQFLLLLNELTYVSHFYAWYILSFFKRISFIYSFLAVLGLCCCTGFSLVVANGDCSLVAVHGVGDYE